MSSPSHVPYQAYKSKRHSRTPSNHLVSNVSPTPTPSRPSSVISNYSISSQPRESTPEPEVSPPRTRNTNNISLKSRPHSMPPNGVPIPIKTNGIAHEVSSAGASLGENAPPRPGTSPVRDVSLNRDSVLDQPSASVAIQDTPSIAPTPNGKVTSNPEPIPGPSTVSASPPPAANPLPVPRKLSSFRRVPLRASTARSPLPSSPLRPAGTHSRNVSTSSTTSRHFEQQQFVHRQTQPRSRITSLTSVHSPATDERPLPTIPASPHDYMHSDGSAVTVAADLRPPHSPFVSSRTHSFPVDPKPPPKPQSPSPAVSSATSSSAISPVPLTPHTPQTSISAAPARAPAPYRPGFQPKGVYRPRTEEFTEARSIRRNVGRIERTKLERRLEKLTQLHFSADADKSTRSDRPAIPNRRASGFFDLDFSDLRNMDASELWRGVLQSQALQGGKADVRVAEQRITPWQNDKLVSKCPLCMASFHPLTNRKHHCRLCGQIICSLPVKRSQRPVTCSLLFIVDPKTRRIEEVGEGVDYGVRKRRSITPQSNGKEKEETLLEDEKFLKGVRICRECRPVLLRQQYNQEVAHVPTFMRLYEAFINLEKEIEDSLPQFQELILSLSHDDQPTKEASAARKRLLEAFGQYDGLSKRIRKVPCPGGKGSSYDRVQMAIASRANLFLQKNMFPLQSLPKPKVSKSTRSSTPDDGPVIDPDSAIAHALQPLLEQEALLESFVEEANAHRKFEDAKTLKTNLQEIKAEIDRIMANADVPTTHPSGKYSKSRR